MRQLFAPGRKLGLRSLAAGMVVVIAGVGGTAWAVATVASIVGSDGVIHGCYTERTGALRVVAPGTACDRGEQAIEWNQQGPQGATGPQGPAGPGLTSLADLNQVACDTGNIDWGNGRVNFSVASTTGVITLTCKTSNPMFVIQSDPGPSYTVYHPGGWTCIWGNSGCSYTPAWTETLYYHYSANEVDADGNPVAGGFQCLGGSSNSTASCSTQRYAPGTVVQFAATGTIDGYVPAWSGCDSVAANICTVAVTSTGATIRVTPTPAS